MTCGYEQSGRRSGAAPAAAAAAAAVALPSPSESPPPLLPAQGAGEGMLGAVQLGPHVVPAASLQRGPPPQDVALHAHGAEGEPPLVGPEALEGARTGRCREAAVPPGQRRHGLHRGVGRGGTSGGAGLREVVVAGEVGRVPPAPPEVRLEGRRSCLGHPQHDDRGGQPQRVHAAAFGAAAAVAVAVAAVAVAAVAVALFGRPRPPFPGRASRPGPALGVRRGQQRRRGDEAEQQQEEEE